MIEADKRGSGTARIYLVIYPGAYKDHSVSEQVPIQVRVILTHIITSSTSIDCKDAAGRSTIVHFSKSTSGCSPREINGVTMGSLLLAGAISKLHKQQISSNEVAYSVWAENLLYTPIC